MHLKGQSSEPSDRSNVPHTCHLICQINKVTRQTKISGNFGSFNCFVIFFMPVLFPCPRRPGLFGNTTSTWEIENSYKTEAPTKKACENVDKPQNLINKVTLMRCQKRSQVNNKNNPDSLMTFEDVSCGFKHGF